ncbi:unnamed protein product [Hymenolepis diminuta]|uniref:Uncharacterized protein n=1 Tax=Hymenolepis diminuta TaxID=6216 RepID=A0A564YIZ4_HYMDI|nr:unnamed protein product [Hymenolepis diminuta]
MNLSQTLLNDIGSSSIEFNVYVRLPNNDLKSRHIGISICIGLAFGLELDR